MNLTTFLDVALASIQTTMIELQEIDEPADHIVDIFCELEQAFARVQRARRMLR